MERGTALPLAIGNCPTAERVQLRGLVEALDRQNIPTPTSRRLRAERHLTYRTLSKDSGHPVRLEAG